MLWCFWNWSKSIPRWAWKWSTGMPTTLPINQKNLLLILSRADDWWLIKIHTLRIGFLLLESDFTSKLNLSVPVVLPLVNSVYQSQLFCLYYANTVVLFLHYILWWNMAHILLTNKDNELFFDPGNTNVCFCCNLCQVKGGGHFLVRGHHQFW